MKTRQTIYLVISIIFFVISISGIPQTVHLLEPDPYTGQYRDHTLEIYLVNTFWLYVLLISGVILFVKLKPISVLKKTKDMKK